MIDEICQREKCTGCSACAQICPKNCISMVPDEEGFLRPVVDGKLCINCGKCGKVCPINHPYDDDGIFPQAYAVKHLNEDVRRNSSSGGAFSAFASYILDNGGAVIGAGFDKNFRVAHQVCTCEDMLDELRRSKYVQSDINGMYREAKQRLENGQEVLFCGTPCQIAGLKSFLGKDYNNLYTIDFICHGVPSPKAWEKYVDFREKCAGSTAKNISFRSKVSGWHNFSMEIKFVNDSMYSVCVGKDPYLRSFIMDIDLRPSCYQCAFKQVHRQSDITVADFWGIQQSNLEIADDKGISLVLIHSERGKKMLDSVQNRVWRELVDCRAAVRGNPSFTKSVSKPPLRNRFMREADTLNFQKLHDKFCGVTLTSKIRRKVARIRLK